uniref:Uncharacterized protein n=1 Tax=Rhizophora mucronata TaxID=61149 RepID=A0A2P2R205_RHIMU
MADRWNFQCPSQDLSVIELRIEERQCVFTQGKNSRQSGDSKLINHMPIIFCVRVHMVRRWWGFGFVCKAVTTTTTR